MKCRWEEYSSAKAKAKERMNSAAEPKTLSRRHSRNLNVDWARFARSHRSTKMSHHGRVVVWWNNSICTVPYPDGNTLLWPSQFGPIVGIYSILAASSSTWSATPQIDVPQVRAASSQHPPPPRSRSTPSPVVSARSIVGVSTNA